MQYTDVLVLSFFSAKIYRQVCFEWRRSAISYILLLAFFASIPSISYFIKIHSAIDVEEIRNYQDLDDGNVNKTIGQVIAQLPQMHFYEHKLSTVDGKSHKIYLPQSDSAFILINTTNTGDTNMEENAKIVITSKEIRFNFGHNRPLYMSWPLYISDFIEEDDLFINKNTIINVVSKLHKNMFLVILLIYLPLIIIVSCIILILRGAFYAAIAWLIFIFTKRVFEFKKIFRVMIVAMSPTIILEICFELLGLQSIAIYNNFYFILNLLSISYLIFALRSCLTGYKKN